MGSKIPRTLGQAAPGGLGAYVEIVVEEDGTDVQLDLRGCSELRGIPHPFCLDRVVEGLIHGDEQD